MAENLGTLNFDVTITDKTESTLKDIKKAIDGLKGGGLDMKLSGTLKEDLAAIKQNILDIQSAAQNITLNTQGLNNIKISSFNVDQATIDALAQRVADTISSKPVTFTKIDTSALTSALTKAIEDSVKMSKGTLMERMKKALTEGASKIRISIDPKSVIDNIEKALNSRNVKISGVTVNKADLAANIREALKGQEFYIKIRIDKQSVNDALNLGNAGNAAGNGMNNAARGAENLHKNIRPLSEQMKTTTQIATILGNSIGNLFSVYAAKNFLESVVNIGGELEKQRMALGAIIGDAEKANTIFKQVSELSMISPFDVQDLITYTKQLSAFGIQYDKLYDTTKRLSDLAAGVGVSFGRIAYEFGQTSARGWLDGRELRMFANSGIPLLQKLSDLYTKLRGEVVTASQVREMVTNRQVSFEDVEKVIKAMTDEGGEFYKMQETMAESLSAKWRNLANDWNLMMGQIAESPVGSLLKKVAEGLMVVVENWQKVIAMAVIGKLLATPFQILNTSLAKGSVLMGQQVRWTGQWSMAMKGLGSSVKNLGNIVKNNLFNIYAMAAAAIAAYVTYLYQARKEEQEYQASINGIGNRINVESESAIIGLNRLIAKLEEAQNNQKEYTSLVSQLRNKYGDYFTTLDEEASKYEEIKKQAAGAAKMIEEKIRAQQIDSTTQEATARYNDRVKALREDMMKALTNDSNPAYGYVRLSKENAESFINDYFKYIKDGLKGADLKTAMGSIYSFNMSKALGFFDIERTYADDYERILEKLNNDIKRIEDGAGHAKYDKYLEKINEYYDDLEKKATSTNEKLKIQHDRLQSSIDVLTKGSATLSDGSVVEGVKFGENAVKNFRSQLAEIELQLSREWVKISNDVIEGFGFNDGSKRTIKADISAGNEDTDYLKYVEKLVKKHKELNESLKKREAIKNGKEGEADAYKYKFEAEELKAVDEILKQLGVDLTAFEKKKAATPKGKDELLESWKEDARVIKEVYDEYKKMYSLYQDSGKAADKVKENPLFANLDINPSAIYENYSKLIERVKAEMGKDPARNKFEIQLEGQRFQIKFDLDKDSYEKASAEITAGMQQLINKEKDNYDFFKQMYDATGDSQYKGKFQELLASVIYSRLNDEGRGVLIDELVLMDDATLRRYVKDAEAIEAVKLALNEYNAAVKATSKEQQQARLSGVKYMQTYKEEMAALNQKYATMMGISIAEGFSSLIELPEDADESIKQLYFDYLRLYSSLTSKSLNSLPWLSNLIEQIRKARAGGGEKKELILAFGNAFSAAANDTATILDNLNGSDQKVKDIVDSLKMVSSVVAKFMSGDYIGAALNILVAMGSSLLENSKSKQESRKVERRNEQLSTTIEVLSKAIEKLADTISEAATIEERMEAYNQQLAKIESKRLTYIKQLNGNYSREMNADDIIIKTFVNQADDIFLAAWQRAIANVGSNDLWSVIEEFYNVANDAEIAAFLNLADKMGIKEAVDGLIEIDDEIKEIEDAIAKANLGFDFSDLKDAFVDTLMDMDSSAEDFWSKFADYAVKASINEFVGKNLQNQLQNVYDDFRVDFTDDGKVSQENIDRWRAQVDAAYATAQKEMDVLNQIWGRGEDEDEGLSSSIQGMTEDTAEIIAAYLNTVTANTTIIRSVEESIAYTQLPMLQMTADSQLTQLEMQTDHLLAIRESNAAIAENVQTLRDDISGTIAGTKQIHMA